MSICAFQPVCATMPRTIKQAGRLGAVNTAASHYRPAKEACMSITPNAITPCAWWQDVAVKFGAFCGTIEEALSTNETTHTGVRTTRTGLTSSHVGGDIMASDIVPSSKTCTKCGKSFPATTEYFVADKRSSSGVGASCLDCERERNRLKMQKKRLDPEYRKQEAQDIRLRRETDPEFRERERENYRRYREIHRDEIITKNRERYANDDEYRARKQQQSRDHRRERYNSDPEWRERALEASRQWRQSNPEYTKTRYAYRQEWRLRNKDRISAMLRERRATDAEFRNRTNAHVQSWRKRNLDSARVRSAKRRAVIRGLETDFTLDDWRNALDYFNGCCAVCGRQLIDLFDTHKAAADHWIPIALGGTNTKLNIVPLCHGEGGCNNHKSSKMPEQWLIEQFGKREGNAILKRIHAYFAWVTGGAE